MRREHRRIGIIGGGIAGAGAAWALDRAGAPGGRVDRGCGRGGRGLIRYLEIMS
ncbi:MAG: hypothetical protein QM820_08795 [Minicystis sp.]